MRLILRTGPVEMADDGGTMGPSVAGPRASDCFRIGVGATGGGSEAVVEEGVTLEP